MVVCLNSTAEWWLMEKCLFGSQILSVLVWWRQTQSYYPHTTCILSAPDPSLVHLTAEVTHRCLSQPFCTNHNPNPGHAELNFRGDSLNELVNVSLCLAKATRSETIVGAMDATRRAPLGRQRILCVDKKEVHARVVCFHAG